MTVSAEAKTVDFLQCRSRLFVTLATADVPFAPLSDLTRCLGPVFTAECGGPRGHRSPWRMGSVVVGRGSDERAKGCNSLCFERMLERRNGAEK